MIQPDFLRKGDTVLVIATARKVSKTEMKPVFNLLKSWGLIPEQGPHLFSSYNQFAGSDKHRAEDLQYAIRHPKAKAVFIARGGYGTVKIIDKINYSALKKYPKWFIGFSDITVLHNRLSLLNLQSIHGPMPITFDKSKAAVRALKNTLFGQLPVIACNQAKHNRIGTARGILTGGNLSILYSLSGTADEVDTDDKILFIEDLDEYLYHIDRMMMQLKRSGKLRNLKALIVGGMSQMKDHKIKYGKNAQQIIVEAVQDYNYPVCFNFPAGHLKKNIPLVFGQNVQLKVSKKGSELIYL